VLRQQYATRCHWNQKRKQKKQEVLSSCCECHRSARLAGRCYRFSLGSSAVCDVTSLLDSCRYISSCGAVSRSQQPAPNNPRTHTLNVDDPMAVAEGQKPLWLPFSAAIGLNPVGFFWKLAPTRRLLVTLSDSRGRVLLTLTDPCTTA